MAEEAKVVGSKALGGGVEVGGEGQEAKIVRGESGEEMAKYERREYTSLKRPNLVLHPK